MIKLSLCNPYDGWRILAPIELHAGHITLCEFEHKKNQFNQMNINFSSDFPRIKTITKTKNWGVRLQTENLDLGFVYYDAIERPYGDFECKLMSAAYLLKDEFLDNKDRYYEGDLATFLTELTDNFEFTSISGSYDIKLVTGVTNQFDLMDEAIKYPDFTEWVDVGLKDTGDGFMKPEIIYGDFRQDFTDSRFPVLYINNFSKIDNTNDNTAIYIDDYKVSKQFERPTLLYPYVDNGSGASENTRTELTQTNPGWLNPQFPIVERTSPVTGKVTRYVRNPFAVPYRERIQEYILNNTSNSEEGVSEEISEEMLYKRTIWYASTMSEEDTVNINPSIKKIVLAGSLAKMQFIDNTKDHDGSIKTDVSITQDKILDNLTYNLNTIYD